MLTGRTLASASTLEKDLGFVGKNNAEAAAKIGATVAERAKKAGVEEVLLRPRRVSCSTAASRRWRMQHAKAG